LLDGRRYLNIKKTTTTDVGVARKSARPTATGFFYSLKSFISSSFILIQK